MTVSPPEPQAPAPAPPAAEPAQHPGFFDKLVHHGEAGQPAPPATPAEIVVARELKPVLQAHAAGVFALATKVFTDPELKVLAPDVLELVIGAAHIAGVAL